MAKLLELLSTTTENLENFNELGNQFDNTGYSSRIRLRAESYDETLKKLMNRVIKSKNDITKEETVVENVVSYELTEIGTTVDHIGECKAIKLSDEKLSNLENKLFNQNSNEEITADDNKSIDEEVTNQEMEVSPVEEENVNSEDTVNSEEADVTDVEENVVIESSHIDEVYQQIMRETEETLKAKEEAVKAQSDVKEAEQLAKEKVEESDKKVLEKSAEQAEIQARKAAAIAKREEIEKSIIAALSAQKSTLGKAKKKYIAQQEESKLKLQEINDMIAKQTEENDKKIIEFQKTIDQELSDLTKVEDEIAKKQAILDALSNPVEFDNSQDYANNFVNPEQENNSYHKKVA